MTKLQTGLGVAAATLAVAALAGAGAAQAQPYGYYDRDGYAPDGPPPAYEDAPEVGGLTIYAPRSSERSAIGAPIETVRESRVVPTDDLDLGTRWGAHVLRVRISRAASDACRDLDQRYPYTAPGSEGPDCYRRAVRHAMYDVVDDLGYVPPTW